MQQKGTGLIIKGESKGCNENSLVLCRGKEVGIIGKRDDDFFFRSVIETWCPPIIATSGNLRVRQRPDPGSVTVREPDASIVLVAIPFPTSNVVKLFNEQVATISDAFPVRGS